MTTSNLTAAAEDASSALKDLASKLTSSASTNPGDVEVAAAAIGRIAAGLDTALDAQIADEATVEPVAAPTAQVAPAPTPAELVAELAADLTPQPSAPAT